MADPGLPSSSSQGDLRYQELLRAMKDYKNGKATNRQTDADADLDPDPDRPSSSSQATNRQTNANADADADADRPSSSSQSDSSDPELEYLKLISDTFGSPSDLRYNNFLRVMTDYYNGKYETLEIISFAQAIFEGHHELLTGFNILLPSGYSIDLAPPKMDLPKNLRRFVDAMFLGHKIKTQLQNDKACYNSFLDLLLEFRRNLCSDELVLEELPIILQDYPDLTTELLKHIKLKD